MSKPGASAPATSAAIVSKSEFARICGVSPGRVTQWIAEKLIDGDALIGAGRTARINVAAAQKQLRKRRDISQALGNGITTRLTGQSPGAPAEPTTSRREPNPRADADDDEDEIASDQLDELLKREKLAEWQRRNRIGEEDEAARKGLYTETAAVRRQLTTIAVQVMRAFEGALPEMATALAADFRAEDREVLQKLNELFRKVRQQVAESNKLAAEALPEFVAAQEVATTET
ncbi:hypothetical protein SAMN05216548_10526 [Faunimonas pinastri]|uniref:Uncharacterized protein n=1 Tax=Faunimonas pinastri TaxID=1855383 RepID=A0A1H9GFR3_9HYPH|nr:hypothetical protein [Faunimonas pinastri]SEQ48955.1 hypothetical protein SAMN05216548_10526 [Faunimonas pinastri]